MNLKLASIVVAIVGSIGVIRVLILLASSNAELILHKLVPCRCRSYFIYVLGRVVHDEKWKGFASIRQVYLRFQVIVFNYSLLVHLRMIVFCLTYKCHGQTLFVLSRAFGITERFDVGIQHWL